MKTVEERRKTLYFRKFPYRLRLRSDDEFIAAKFDQVRNFIESMEPGKCKTINSMEWYRKFLEERESGRKVDLVKGSTLDVYFERLNDAMIFRIMASEFFIDFKEAILA